MATATEIHEVLALLTVNYPYWQREQTEETLSLIFASYEQMLADLPGKVLEEATLQHIAQSKYFPSVAELREQALELMDPQVPTVLYTRWLISHHFRSLKMPENLNSRLSLESLLCQK